MDNEVIKNGTSLIFSLVAYQIAKKNPFIDKIPAMLIGGFIGYMTSYEISKMINKPNKRKKRYA